MLKLAKASTIIKNITILTTIFFYLFTKPALACTDESCFIDHVKGNVLNLKLRSLKDEKIQDQHIPGLLSFLQQHPEITVLDLSDNDVGASGATMLANNSRLASLNLRGNTNITTVGIIALAKNTTLTNLNLSHANVTDEDAKILAQNSKLKSLDVGWNSIGDAGASALAENTTLQSLNLEANSLKSNSVFALAKNTTLKNLSIGFAERYAGDISHEAYHELEKTTTLKTLSLAGNNLDADDFALLAKNQSITSLDVAIGKNLIFSTLGDEAAVTFAKNSHLEYLDMSHDYISDKGAIALAHSPSLKSLKLDSNKAIGKTGITALAKNPNLINLSLYDDEIDSHDAEILAKNTTLFELDLSSNRIGDQGASSLAKNTTIKKLYLSGNKIGDKGAIALSKNLSLNKIFINFNNISDIGAIALADNLKLKELVISYNKIGIAGIKALNNNRTLEYLDLCCQNEDQKYCVETQLSNLRF